MLNISADLPPEEFFSEIMKITGWDMDSLARNAGYRAETLKKARRGHADVALTDKMRAAIIAAAEIAVSRSRLAEESESYRVRLLERGRPVREIMIPAPDEDATLAELEDLLRDFRVASKTGRKRLLTHIDALVTTLHRIVQPSESQTQHQ